jgi:taspase (threonine aspartase 1)
MGMPELPHDALVSPAAKERWLRWKSDLKNAERKARKTNAHPSTWKTRLPTSSSDHAEQERLRREHTKSLLQGYPTLARPISPIPSEEVFYYAADETPDPSRPHSTSSMESVWSEDRVTTPESLKSELLPMARASTVEESSRSAFINSTQKVPTISQYQNSPTARKASFERVGEETAKKGVGRRSWGDGSEEQSDSASSAVTMRPPAVPTNTPSSEMSLGIYANHPISETASTSNDSARPTGAGAVPGEDKDDHITDTVGAIAIDGWGNIACAASSGGIGMKYRGRVGPAALVGVGAAVVPIDPDDKERTCVGTVASGTGEHMATTMAATVCAERLYQSVKKRKGGEYEEVTEDEALREMIEREFMGEQHASLSHGGDTRRVEA